MNIRKHATDAYEWFISDRYSKVVPISFLWHDSAGDLKFKTRRAQAHVELP